MTVIIPTAPDELKDVLLDRKKMDEIYADPAGFAEFITNYANAVNKVDKDIERQVEEQVQKGLADFARDNLVNIRRPDQTRATPDDVKANRATGAAYNKAAMGAALDGEFDSFTDFLKTIDHNTDRREAPIAERIGKLRNAMSSTVPADGGFLIPETFRAELLRVALEQSIVRPRARVIPMDSMRVALPALDVTSNASSVFGGIIGYWTDEAAALTSSQPAFARVVLEAKKLTAYSEVPNELMQDSAISFEAFINEAFPAAVAWYEDVAFMNGSGVGEPLGALSSANPAAIAVTAETAQTTKTIVWENIVNMYSRMLPSSLGGAVWVAAIDTFPQLATMALSVGTGGAPVWMGNGAVGAPMTILGRPLVFTEKASALGSQGDISFVDFGHYLIGDRMAMTALSSPHYKFGNDVTAFRVIERVDGRPWLQSAITPRNASSNTLSPFVQLAAR